MSEQNGCAHCGLPIPPAMMCSIEIDDARRDFCCHGCRIAFQIVCGAGLQSYYQNRLDFEPGLPAGAYTTTFDDSYLASFLTESSEGSQLSFLIEGVRCVSCVWVIEHLLEQLPGISQVRINYSTHRARVLFDPERISPAAILQQLIRIGYVPRPVTPDTVRESSAREGRMLLIRFGTAALFSMQVMGFTIPLYAGYFQGIDQTSRLAMTWLAALTSLPVIFYSGWPFLRGAWRALRIGTPNMDLLVALGVVATYAYSLYALAMGDEVYFDTAVMIITLILLGRLLEHFARQRAISRIDRLLQLAPEQAIRLTEGVPETVPSSSLKPGDLILVRPGERFPVDGDLATGEAEIDESAISGEPLPVLKQPGASVSAGTVNLITAVTVRVTASTADSLPARIARLVEEALARRAPVQLLADRTAGFFVPFVLLTSVLTALAWKFAGASAHDCLLRSVAVLVVACPCALGLATPMAILVATGAGAARGILFRGGDVLERTGKICCVAFDKTGTLTEGNPRLVSFEVAAGGSEEELLSVASLGAATSAHPLAVGIRTALANRYSEPSMQLAARAIPGAGIIAAHPAGELRMGNRLLLEEAGIAPLNCGHGSLTEVHLSLAGRYLGVLHFDDPIRSDSDRVVSSLRGRRLHCAMLTGDRTVSALRVAGQVGIDDVAAELRPEQKADWIRRREDSGERVLMVGDGINDTPALAAATVGCAMAGGTAVALEASDLILTRPSLERLSEALLLAKRCNTIIRQNLFWAFVYNLLAIPLAVTGTLAPIHAAAAMALSSLCVVANSLRLSRPLRGI